jgi:hypothetical protein
VNAGEAEPVQTWRIASYRSAGSFPTPYGEMGTVGSSSRIGTRTAFRYTAAHDTKTIRPAIAIVATLQQSKRGCEVGLVVKRR